MGIRADIQSLSPSALIELFVIDTTHLPEGGVFHFHAGTNELRQSVIWQGVEYTPFPVKAEGFEARSEGTLPRPTLSVANADGLMSILVRDYQDLLGSTVTRIHTLAQYLDAINFADGNPTADPTQEFQRETWIVDRKSLENDELISFELASPHDVMGQQLPARQIIRNTCVWLYRSPECGYCGGPVADATDAYTSDPAKDRCSRRLSGCKKRFGEYAELPFGGFPAAGLMR